MVREALAGWAVGYSDGMRYGVVYSPTVLPSAPDGARVLAEEAFDPAVGVHPFGDMAAAVHEVNTTEYARLTGRLTRDTV